MDLQVKLSLKIGEYFIAVIKNQMWYLTTEKVSDWYDIVDMGAVLMEPQAKEYGQVLEYKIWGTAFLWAFRERQTY